MASKNIIGQRIKTMRLSRGMTQADLAKALDQSQASITMYETGKREPDFETLEALADVFNVPLVSFVDDGDVVSVGSSDAVPASKDEIRILFPGASKLPPERLELIKNSFLSMLKGNKSRII